MGQLSLVLPTPGVTPNASADPELVTALSAIQAWANGGQIDSTNIAASLAQSAAVNQAGQTVKGAVNIAGPHSTGSTTYTTLTTPDQVSGIVLSTNGKIIVDYQATWQESVAGAARAAIFLNANQLQVSATPEAAATGAGSAGVNHPLASFWGGLASMAQAVSADVTTGQAIGGVAGTGIVPQIDLNGSVSGLWGAQSGTTVFGGSCEIFAAAGTYTVSVQFKASSGSVTASNRHLWVEARS